jgi:TatA/E family protein of Tat protein translocase
MTQLPLPLFLDISGGEFIILIIAVFVIFGPKRMPEIARTLGKGMNELKKVTSDLTKEFKDGVNQVKEDVTIIPPDIYGNKPYTPPVLPVKSNPTVSQSRLLTDQPAPENPVITTQTSEQRAQTDTNIAKKSNNDDIKTSEKGLLF